jgi:hypothetical protein
MSGPDATDRPLITGTELREYFHEELQHVIDKQHLHASADATCYVLNVLTSFLHSERLFEHAQDGRMLKPLAQMYADALEAPTAETRVALLRRLADVALFISGIFSDSLKRKTVDVNYYVAMGGSAYGYLSDSLSRWARGRALSPVFGELSGKFQQFVDVLNEVSERAHLNSDNDVLRTYELWLKTGSRRAQRRLVEQGLQPIWAPGDQRPQ